MIKASVFKERDKEIRHPKKIVRCHSKFFFVAHEDHWSN